MRVYFAFLLILAGLLFGGIAERNSPEVTAQIEREVAEKKASVTPAERIALLPPLACDATVSQRGAGEPWKTRCYVRSEK